MEKIESDLGQMARVLRLLNFVPMYAMLNEDSGELEYAGYSPKFRGLGPSEDLPIYHLNLQMNQHGRVVIATVKEQREP